MGKDLESKIENGENLREVLGSGRGEEVDNGLVELGEGIEKEILKEGCVECSEEGMVGGGGGGGLRREERKY
ncbi:hypothetical protein [Bacillus thuringiensis]|uniref:hypothetical protein n=1 Tax=Bacillus thuringiensis TaxID=1428 RepID=UPI0011A8BC1F|nr:hypothetical protein [Bacillus thuringiensis]